jgi:glucose dehydrogenase
MKGVIITAAMLASLSFGSKAADPGEGDSWPMYGRNLEHTFSNPHSQIGPRTVAQVKPAWTFPTGDAVTASPAVVGGTVYVGSWDGFFYALDGDTGQQRWKFQLDCQRTVVPLPQVCGGLAQVTQNLSASLPLGGS